MEQRESHASSGSSSTNLPSLKKRGMVEKRRGLPKAEEYGRRLFVSKIKNIGEATEIGDNWKLHLSASCAGLEFLVSCTGKRNAIVTFVLNGSQGEERVMGRGSMIYLKRWDSSQITCGLRKAKDYAEQVLEIYLEPIKE